MPSMVLGTTASDSRSRERISRKPPLPRAVTTIATKAGRAISTTHIKQQAPIKARPVSKPSTAAVTRSTTKPRLPPRLKPAGPQVNVDALVISAQLVPWISMRIALESQLKPLEAAFENVVQQERQRLDKLETSIREAQQRSKLQGQIEMLEDLHQNKPFATLLVRVLSQISSFEATEGPHSTTDVSSKLQLLQDQIQSNDEELGQLEADLASRLNSVHELQGSIRQLKHQLSTDFKAYTRWDSMLNQLEALVASRLQTLGELAKAIPFVRKLQRTRIELEVLRIGTAGS